jgi:acetylornithine deacetylase/succinyl-diaminopimelate desuccinylase-like protein
VFEHLSLRLCGLALTLSALLVGAAALAAEPSTNAQAASQACPRAMTMAPAELEAEAVCLLRHYVQIDTTNPPGNERASADFLAALLAREGIEAKVFESVPGRANLYARLHGDGSRKALMLVHHMDVVPADAGQWSVPPFGAEVRDGYVWGRGTLDNKGPGIMEVLSFIMLKRLKLPLARDVVLLAVADEEQGGGKGARYMMAEHFDLFADVEFALNEGGAMLKFDDGHMLYAVEFAQKVPLWLKLTASGPAGHASLPKPAAATHTLVRALARLEQFQFPVVVVPEVQQVFTQRAATMPAAQRAPYSDLKKSLAEPAFRAEFLKDAHNAAMVHNTLAITMLSGSDKENVYPAQASAVLDLRLLPGQDPQVVTAELKRVMGEAQVQIDTLLSSTAHASPLDTELYKAITALIQRHDAGAQVTANFIGGFTDCNTFRGRGITCYGFMPMHLPMAETERVHGRDERLLIDDLVQATTLLQELVRDVAGR